MSETDDTLPALTWLFPSDGPQDENTFHYGPLTLSIPSRTGKAITLLADQVFNPALVFAEQIDLGVIDIKDKTVCELGAGSGLPGIYAFTRGARRVVLTDYPDENILNCLWENVKRNIPEENVKEKGDKDTKDGRWCTVAGYDWGKETQHVKDLVESFDVLFLADLLWYNEAHEVLLDSVTELLDSNGIAWVGCGEYSTLKVCESFMKQGEQRGLKSRRVELTDKWEGREKCSLENLSERKRRVWVWEMSWVKR